MAANSRRCAAYAAFKMISAFCLLLLTQILESNSEAQKAPVVRDVTPPGINRVYRSEDTSTISESNLPKFFDVQVLPNGALQSGIKTIQLYGVKLPDRRTLCTSSSGTRWTCGVAAYVALRNLVQSRSIACNIMTESEQIILGRCSVEQTDIGAWMLQKGWAELAAGVDIKTYTDAAAQAKASALGLWGNGPPPINF